MEEAGANIIISYILLTMTIDNEGIDDAVLQPSIADEKDDAYDEFLQFVHADSVVTDDYSLNPSASSKEKVETASSSVNGEPRVSVKIVSNNDVESGNGSKAITTPSRSSSALGISRRGSLQASTTETRRNPFAMREGHALIWSNVSMVLVSMHYLI